MFTAKPDTLYFTDNGATLCGEHLGSSAKHTGRDISGQEIVAISPDDARFMLDTEGELPCCERCMKKASLLSALEG